MPFLEYKYSWLHNGSNESFFHKTLNGGPWRSPEAELSEKATKQFLADRRLAET